MKVEDKNIIWLDTFEFLTYHKKDKILKLFAHNEDIRKEFLKNPHLKEILNEHELRKMSICLEDRFLERKIEEYASKNVQCITINDERYPNLLKEIPTPPFCLYCKGNISLLNTLCLGVVGSRKPTDYGLVITKQFSKELAKNNITIVSGMALGVDSIAHKSVLEENGNTIAVLGGGFNYIYPASNISLSKQIEENNLLVSEYNPNIKPETYYFPARNRIIAGLSRGVLVTEAREKSGALITIDYAIEFNRDIFAIPGKINSDMSKGTNALIKSLQSCIVLEPKDILDAWNILEVTNTNKTTQLNMNSEIVLSFIKTENKTFQELVELTKIPTKELNTILMELEMEGIVTKLSGNRYIAS